MPRAASGAAPLAVLAAAALTLSACATSPRAARDDVDPNLTSRARGCEGTRIAEVRNDGQHAVDVYFYRGTASNPVFLRTLVRGSVAEIPLEADARTVFTRSSQQAGAPAGTADRVNIRYLCRNGA